MYNFVTVRLAIANEAAQPMGSESPVRDHIFISYRRDDTLGASGLLYDWLRIGFGRERVFRDVHSIGVGKWRDKIDQALIRSAVCVVVVGKRWANADNLRRLKAKDDMVRHELVSALASDGLTLVPTLVEGAGVPKSKSLPVKLRPLFEKWNARHVTENGWEEDTRRLITEIAEAAELAVGPDLDTLLRNAGAAQLRVAELEETKHLQSSQIEALKDTVNDLTRKLAEAPSSERPSLVVAFAAWARGDTRAAEDAFEREYAAESQTEEAARQELDQAQRRRAVAARNVANLALLRDVTKAVAFYQKALEFEADHVETALLLGYALVQFGDLQGARGALLRSLQAAITHGDLLGEMRAQGALSDLYLRLGDLEQANRTCSKELELAERHSVADPANTEWQRDLSVSLIKFGNVLKTQGDGPGALAAFRKSLTIRKVLAARDPSNTRWQRDVSVSHIKIGNVLEAQGDGQEALAAYRKSLAICEMLVARDPANTQWQRDLLLSHTNVGDVLATQGNRPEALAAYRRSLAICEALATQDPANTEWQRDLSVSHIKIGNALNAQGDGQEALAAYRKSLAIGEVLAARDPTNTQWQRDLSLSYDMIGDMLMARDNGSGALAAYRKGLALREVLAARDPANTEWQRDLSLSYDRIGEVLVVQDDGPGHWPLMARVSPSARCWLLAILPTLSGNATSRSATSRSATC
jgi:tetratricopeptide (TPR) repeat protein